MPVVTIHALNPDDPAVVTRCLHEVALELGAAIGRDPDQVWVYWCPVQVALVGGQIRAFEGHCPVVDVRAREGRDAADVERAVTATARAVSQSLQLPLQDVWVHWVEIPAGRVFAGGAVR